MSKRAKTEVKVSAQTAWSGDCWACILVFLSAKEHCITRGVSKFLRKAGEKVSSWSPVVVAPTEKIATQLQSQGCTAPPRELRLGYTPLEFLQWRRAMSSPATQKWLTANLRSLHFETNDVWNNTQLACAPLLPALESLSVTVNNQQFYYTEGGLFTWDGGDKESYFGPSLQTLVLKRFFFSGAALANLKWPNLTVLRLDDCSTEGMYTGVFWDALRPLQNQLVELGVPMIMSGFVQKTLFVTLPVFNLPKLIRLWGHMPRDEAIDDVRVLLDTYLPNLQRLYVITESKRDATKVPWSKSQCPSKQFFDEVVRKTQRSVGVAAFKDHSDLAADEAAHRKLGNWATTSKQWVNGQMVPVKETKSVWIVYATQPRARSPFDPIVY